MFWEYLGETNIDSMVLLCRHHHNMVHAGTLIALMVAGVPMFLDRHGNELTAGRRRPPPWADAA